MSETDPERYRFILFVAGGQPNSILARQNLTEVCRELTAEYDLEIVDVMEDAKSALEHGVVVTPALLVLNPLPKVVIAGTLTNRGKVRTALRITSEASA